MALNKEQFLKNLYDSNAMKVAMSQIKTEKEKNQIKACVDEIIGQFYENVVNAYAPVQNNLDLIKKLVESEETSLINNESIEKPTQDK